MRIPSSCSRLRDKVHARNMHRFTDHLETYTRGAPLVPATPQKSAHSPRSPRHRTLQPPATEPKRRRSAADAAIALSRTNVAREQAVLANEYVARPRTAHAGQSRAAPELDWERSPDAMLQASAYRQLHLEAITSTFLTEPGERRVQSARDRERPLPPATAIPASAVTRAAPVPAAATSASTSRRPATASATSATTAAAFLAAAPPDALLLPPAATETAVLAQVLAFMMAS